jgi:proline dehydrogenase
VERIVQRLPAGSRLEVSAEESWWTNRILSAVLQLARDGAPVMPTLQKRQLAPLAQAIPG